MSLFRRHAAQHATAPPTVAESLQKLIETSGRPSLFAASEFVKQVDCAQCGARKRLPSKTAYLYCDYCGALVDYDFRLANSGTNAALTNTVFHRLIAPVQPGLDRARAAGDADRYRELLRGVYTEWLRECPQAASPRVKSDEDFRDRVAAYSAEQQLRQDFDPGLFQLRRQLSAAENALVRLPNGTGPWLVSDGIWQVAAMFKQLIDAEYQMYDATGVSAMDPDEAPPGVEQRMEYSIFCQGWIPHLRPGDVDRLLSIFGLTSEYARVDVTGAVTKKCGGCGAELSTLPGANAVICESCGRKLDIAGGEVPCPNCGAQLSFPVGASAVECPYCHTGTHRV
jgi:LSD1 subclass zinc finger protein